MVDSSCPPMAPFKWHPSIQANKGYASIKKVSLASMDTHIQSLKYGLLPFSG